jgi:DMSO reductase family type II enzyme chaperone
MDRLLARATVYRTLALLFGHPRQWTQPGCSIEERLNELQRAADTLREVHPIAEEVGAVHRAVEQTRLQGAAETEEAFNDVFLPGAPRYRPPYETEYLGDEVFAKTRELADIAGFYRAFELRVSSTSAERLDHLSVELEFVAMLLAKEAFAVANGWREKADIARSAAGKFLRDHLAAWVPAFARSLDDQAIFPLYRAAARLVRAFLAKECAELGITLPKTPLTLPIVTPPPPIACPADASG